MFWICVCCTPLCELLLLLCSMLTARSTDLAVYNWVPQLASNGTFRFVRYTSADNSIPQESNLDIFLTCVDHHTSSEWDCVVLPSTGMAL